MVCAQRRHRSAWASAQSDQSSLSTKWVAKDPSLLHADSEDSDQTGRMPRLIWVFAGRTCHFVGFVTHWLKLEEWAIISEKGHHNKAMCTCTIWSGLSLLMLLDYSVNYVKRQWRPCTEYVNVQADLCLPCQHRHYRLFFASCLPCLPFTTGIFINP